MMRKKSSQYLKGKRPSPEEENLCLHSNPSERLAGCTGAREELGSWHHARDQKGTSFGV